MTVIINVNKGDYKGSVFITGFHGIGETGYIATSFLVHALHAERVGFIEVEHPPPFVNATPNTLVTPFEIYRKDKMVITKLEFSPHKSEEAEFIKTLSSWVVKERFKNAVLIGGLDSSFKTGNSLLRVIHTRAYKNRTKALNAPRLEEELSVYGPLALMLSEFEIHNFPALAILPYASSARPDPAAAAVAVRSICRTYKMEVNVSDLEKDAKYIETEIEQRMKQAHKSLQGMFV